MSSDNLIDHVVQLVENLFGLIIEHQSIAVIQRPYDSYLLTLKFSTTNHQTYLIKEFQHQAPHHLQVLFSALEKIRNQKPLLSFPLPAKNEYYYFTGQGERHFQLLKFLELAHFDEKTVSLTMLFNELAKLHLNLSQCPIPPNQYTDLRAYVVLGLRRIQNKYGANLPFLPKLESFINHLSLASIRQGVRHGDIQETNVCHHDGEVIFIDGDVIHFGYPLMDYVQAAVMYLDQDNLNRPENHAVVEALWQQVKPEASALTRKDVRYLLARVMLGPIQGGDIQPDQETLRRFLLDLERFSEG